MQDCIMLQCKSKLLLSALLLLVVCAFLCEDCVSLNTSSDICFFHISLFGFHFIPCFLFQNISHFSPASYDCVEMRNGTKDNSISYVDKRQVRRLCVFIVAFCIGLQANLNVRSLVVPVDIVKNFKTEFYILLLFSKKPNWAGMI